MGVLGKFAGVLLVFEYGVVYAFCGAVLKDVAVDVTFGDEVPSEVSKGWLVAEGVE